MDGSRERRLSQKISRVNTDTPALIFAHGIKELLFNSLHEGEYAFVPHTMMIENRGTCGLGIGLSVFDFLLAKSETISPTYSDHLIPFNDRDCAHQFLEDL